jgi:hypothetical protein
MSYAEPGFREISREDFIQRLIDAGWTREEAEREAREILDEGRDDEDGY